MNRQQFIIMAFFTVAETYYFNESIMEQRYIMALLWAILILRNFRVAILWVKLSTLLMTIFEERSNPQLLDKIKAF